VEPQVVMTLPLLLSWDGEKMSGSRGNYIGLTEPPDEQFGKTMSIPDERMQQWWELVAEQPPPPGEPMEQKLALARWIVARAHGEEAAQLAAEQFDSVVRRRETPDDLPDVAIPAGDPVHLPAFLVDAFGVNSTSEARRLISQGGVKLAGEPIAEIDLPRASLAGAVLQVGKRRHARLVEA
jgi:tyrosyl-tRNA synthetase